LSGTEGVNHFLQVPQIVTKSMGYHYPAEFIVPTNIPFDVGPIGQAIETEFERPEMPVGLLLQDMLKGMLVTGGTASQRFLINLRIVYEMALAEGNYLIITTSPQWRRILDLFEHAKVFRLGTDLTINLLDPEGVELSEYTSLITQVFAQTLNLSRAGVESLTQTLLSLLTSPEPQTITTLEQELEKKLVAPRETPHGLFSTELGMVYNFLSNLGHGSASQIFLETSVPFAQLLQNLTVIEVNMKNHQQVQFVLLCVLAKVLASGIAESAPPCMVLVDNADFLTPLDPQLFKVKESEPYLHHLLRRIREHGLGLHLNLKDPSRLPLVLLNSIQTILAHQTTAYHELRLLRDLLQFLPDRLVHSDRRHDNYQVDYLKTLAADRFILKRVDIPNAFPVRVSRLDLSETHIPSDQELQDRLRALIPGWDAPAVQPRSLLEIDFRAETPLVLKILSLLLDYSSLGRQGLLSSLNSELDHIIDMAKLDQLLYKLSERNYIAPIVHVDPQNHRYSSYRLTDKGQQAYRDYLAAHLPPAQPPHSS
jgi:hypothetical protein